MAQAVCASPSVGAIRDLALRYRHLFGPRAVQEDGKEIFRKVLGEPPDGQPYWKLSTLPTDRESLTKIAAAWCNAVENNPYKRGNVMVRYRKKPIAVEAMQFPGHSVVNVDAMLAFEDWLFPKATAAGMSISYRGSVAIIPTLEGEMEARPGDWIICGVAGELYPCKPDIFAATYEATDD